jgi:hypothetical protein
MPARGSNKIVPNGLSVKTIGVLRLASSALGSPSSGSIEITASCARIAMPLGTGRSPKGTHGNNRFVFSTVVPLAQDR